MDRSDVKAISALISQIELCYVVELETEYYRRFHLLDELLNPVFEVTFLDTDTLEVIYDPNDGSHEPFASTPADMVLFLILTRLLDKSLEEKPDELDLIPF